MNDGNKQQETPQEISKALKQLQALQLQQAKLQMQAQVQGPSDADLLALQLPPNFGGRPAEHHPGASSSGGGTPVASARLNLALSAHNLDQI